MTSEPIIRNAASVILVREVSPCAPQIFLVRRHNQSRFMGGQYVFPGGKCDGSDSSKEILERCVGMDAPTAGKILGIPPEQAIGHFVGGIRETFEEARVLLAVDRSGSPVSNDEVDAAHTALSRMGWLQMLVERDWFLDLGQLRYFSHWITPKVAPRRFSARFFIARAPVSQVASFDAFETTDGQWFTADGALEAHVARKLVLPPPQLRTLMQLREIDSVKHMLEHAAHRPVPAVEPVFITGDPPRLVLEGDELHPLVPGVHRRRFNKRQNQWIPEFSD